MRSNLLAADGLMISPNVAVHIVTFNSACFIDACLSSVFDQEPFASRGSLPRVIVTDNASSDETVSVLEAKWKNRIVLKLNSENLGFAAAQNQGIAQALEGGADFVLVLNPDVRLEKQCLARLVEVLSEDLASGMAVPKLLRSDDKLIPLARAVIDSAGMLITPGLRHFDRGSGKADSGQYDRREYIFGASGACVLLRREFVVDVSIPPIVTGKDSELFDERFFAYREDADLSWRARWLGWSCVYEPTARAYHRRLVLPERRKMLPAEINCWSVRNRFLLQANNFSLLANAHCVLPGLWRNLVVLVGVLLVERSSIAGVWEAIRELPRSFRRRRWVMAHARESSIRVGRWFRRGDYSEPSLIKHRTLNGPVSCLAVIVNYCSGERLRACIECLLDSRDELKTDARVEILVFDNASSDASAQRAEARFKDTQGLSFAYSKKNLGFAGAINQASSSKSWDFLLILNPDVRVNASALSEMFEIFGSFSNLALAGPVLVGEGGEIQWNYTARRFPCLASAVLELLGLHRLCPSNPWTAEYLLKNDALFQERVTGRGLNSGPAKFSTQPVIVEQPAGACLLVRRSAFEALNGFDSDYWPAWFEDVDFAKRASRLGWCAAVVPSARICHEGGYSKDILGPVDFAKCWYPNMLRYWRKHGTIIEYAVFRVVFALALVLRALFAIVQAALLAPFGLNRACEKVELARLFLSMVIQPKRRYKISENGA